MAMGMEPYRTFLKPVAVDHGGNPLAHIQRLKKPRKNRRTRIRQAETDNTDDEDHPHATRHTKAYNIHGQKIKGNEKIFARANSNDIVLPAQDEEDLYLRHMSLINLGEHRKAPQHQKQTTSPAPFQPSSLLRVSSDDKDSHAIRHTKAYNIHGQKVKGKEKIFARANSNDIDLPAKDDHRHMLFINRWKHRKAPQHRKQTTSPSLVQPSSLPRSSSFKHSEHILSQKRGQKRGIQGLIERHKAVTKETYKGSKDEIDSFDAEEDESDISVLSTLGSQHSPLDIQDATPKTSDIDHVSVGSKEHQPSYTKSYLSSNKESEKESSLRSLKSSRSHPYSSSLLLSGSKSNSDSTASLRRSKLSSTFSSSSYSSRRSSYRKTTPTPSRSLSSASNVSTSSLRSRTRGVNLENKTVSSEGITAHVHSSPQYIHSSNSTSSPSGVGGTHRIVQNLESESDLHKRTETKSKRQGVGKRKADTTEVITSQNGENKDTLCYPLSPLQKMFGTCMDFEDTTNVQLVKAKVRILSQQLQQVDLQRRPGLVWLLETTMWRLKRKLGQSYPEILSCNRSNCLPLFSPLVADDAPVLARNDNRNGLQVDEYTDLVAKQRLKMRLNTNFECIMNNLSTLSQTPTKDVCEYQSCFGPNGLVQPDNMICTNEVSSEHQHKCSPCSGQIQCTDQPINPTVCLTCPSQEPTCTFGMNSPPRNLLSTVCTMSMRTKAYTAALNKSGCVLFVWLLAFLQTAYKNSCVFNTNIISQIPTVACIVHRRVYQLSCRVLTTNWCCLLIAASWLHSAVSWSLTTLMVATSLVARGWGLLPQLVTPFVDELSNFSQTIQTECVNSRRLPSTCRQKQTDVIQAFRTVGTKDDLLVEQTTVQRKRRSHDYPNPNLGCAGSECGSCSDDQELIDIFMNKLSVQKREGLCQNKPCSVKSSRTVEDVFVSKVRTQRERLSTRYD